MKKLSLIKHTGNKRLDGTFAPGNKIGHRFKPGESGCPTGRRGALRDLFDAAFSKPDTKTGLTARDAAIRQLMKHCRKGNLKAIRTWLEWSLSKPPQEINVGPSENLIEYQAKKKAVMDELLESLPKKAGGEVKHTNSRQFDKTA